MKGLILAGGAGTRVRPITHTSAKQLVPVANKPILFYGIEDMVAAGIREIGMTVGATRDEIIAPVGDGSLGAIQPSGGGERETTDAIRGLIRERHRVLHAVLEGWWLDTGKKDPLLESNRRILETIEHRIDGSVDAESQIEGFVVVDAG